MNSVHFFFQAEDGIRDQLVTGVQTCALPIWSWNILSTEAEAQSAVVKMFHDLKGKGVDRNKLEVKIEPRLTLSPKDIVEVIRILVELRNGRDRKSVV